jgi:AraC family transcriptional regulator, positive regulator of tynA and feaB
MPNAGRELMEMLFSTKNVHPRHRFDYWHEVACKNIVQHNSQPECRSQFHAAIQVGSLADLGLILFENSPMDVARTPEQIAHSTNDEMLFCHQLQGDMELKQNRRELLLRPGEFALVDPRMPYVGRFPSPARMFVLKIPRRTLETRIRGTSEIVFRSIKPSENAEASLTSSYLAMLPDYTGRLAPTGEEMVKNQALDLIALSLGKLMGANTPNAPSVNLAARDNARRAVEALPHPTLSPELVTHQEAWPKSDLFFMIDSLRHGRSLNEVAGFLGRDENEVRLKAKELKLTNECP